MTYLIIASLVGWALGGTLYFAGLKWISVSRAVPLAYSYPLFTPPFSIAICERLTANIAIGSFAIVAALWLISGSIGEDLYVTPRSPSLNSRP
jgi:drug/metabolite transporter (DMT)-like permease